MSRFGHKADFFFQDIWVTQFWSEIMKHGLEVFLWVLGNRKPYIFFQRDRAVLFLFCERLSQFTNLIYFFTHYTHNFLPFGSLTLLNIWFTSDLLFFLPRIKIIDLSIILPDCRLKMCFSKLYYFRPQPVQSEFWYPDKIARWVRCFRTRYLYLRQGTGRHSFKILRFEPFEISNQDFKQLYVFSQWV
jgi:hypothetical protein